MSNDKSKWLQQLKPGDIGLTAGSQSIFGKLQNLYRKRVSKAPIFASHGFVVKNDGRISEADGKYVKESKISRYFGKKRKVWIFRYSALTPRQLSDMMIYLRAAEESGGTYSWLGIFEFVRKFFRRKRDLKDRRGVFCTEHSSRTINAAGLPYIELGRVEPWEVTPSIQLSWFIDEGEKWGWQFPLYFDGENFLTNKYIC